MGKLKKIVICLGCLIVCSSLLCCHVLAGDLDDYYTDNSSGWSFKTNKLHRGSKLYSYIYASQDVQATYASDFLSAISLWGSNIDMSLISSSRASSDYYGIITVQDDESSNAVATAGGYSYYNSTGHYSGQFTITINKAKYDSKSSGLKHKALAHEIGHIYGLDHFSNSSKIMNPTLSSTMTISTTDVAGMELCTHVHTHTSSTRYAYNSYNSQQHKKRCVTCKAYTLDNHNLNSNNVCSACGMSFSGN